MISKITKIFLLSLVFLLLLAVLASSGLLLLVSARTGVPAAEFVGTFQNLILRPAFSDSRRLNVLLLGLDYRQDWLENTKTTDTIIFASYNFDSNRLHLISLPRDLWDESLPEKINQIYPLSLSQPWPQAFIKEKYSRILGQQIDRVLVLTTSDLTSLIDLVGGVDLVLDYDYTDSAYPNPEYINHPSPSVPVYITVSFKKGVNHLDSTNVAAFVRSRHGAETEKAGGTDLGRIQRQQLLLDALFKKLTTPETFKNLSLLNNLYRWWHTQVETDLTDHDLLSLAFRQRQNLTNVTLNRIQIPVGTGSTDGLIYHPSQFSRPQWVFLPSDPSWLHFRRFITDQIQD